jgi:hypothetical protein
MTDLKTNKISIPTAWSNSSADPLADLKTAANELQKEDKPDCYALHPNVWIPPEDSIKQPGETTRAAGYAFKRLEEVLNKFKENQPRGLHPSPKKFFQRKKYE